MRSRAVIRQPDSSTVCPGPRPKVREAPEPLPRDRLVTSAGSSLGSRHQPLRRGFGLVRWDHPDSERQSTSSESLCRDKADLHGLS